jgi:16S rRNA (cytidine1402-2'-O)-methyltransferase
VTRTGPGGQLVLVATPIGHLGDLSPRAVEVLADADAIACEDARRTGRLLQHAGVARTRLLVVNDHTEAAQVGEVLALLDQGRTVAVVTDAGTPGISDPGERLVRAAVAAGHAVSVVPGASAVVAAVVLSGLPTGRFCFEGFLPRSGSGRRERIEALAGERRTIGLYEAPHRLARTLDQLAAVLGADRPVALVRELTKLHEEVWRGTLGQAAARTDEVEPRGEYTVVVGGAAAPPAASEDDVADALRRALAAGHERRDAVRLVAATLGLPRRQVYDVALALRAEGSS